MADRSLRRSLLRWLVFPLMPLLVCGALIAFQLAWRASGDALDLALLDAALDLSRQVRMVGGAPVLELPMAARQMLAVSNEDRVVYAVRDEGGALLAGDGTLSFAPAGEGEGRPRFFDAVVDRTPVRAIALRSEAAPGGIHVDIAVAQTLKARERQFASILAGLLGPELLLVAASLAIVWFGVRRGLGPAERLRSEIVSRSPQDLRPIDEASAPAELRPLLHAINGLLARLEAALGGQRQFISDAAHQLRTPLAVLRARIELALGEPGSPPRETLDELLAATERTTRLANQLLSLARAENILAAEETHEEVDLKQLVTDSAGDWVLRAADGGLDLAFEVQPAAVSGSPFLIAEMLGNLLDNAVRYTPAGGAITVRSGRRDGAPFLEVEDTGPGIPEAYRDKALQRFFRLPGTPTEGCGLGLSIVAEIARAHEARLALSAPGQGTGLIATIRFPASSAN